MTSISVTDCLADNGYLSEFANVDFHPLPRNQGFYIQNFNTNFHKLFKKLKSKIHKLYYIVEEPEIEKEIHETENPAV